MALAVALALTAGPLAGALDCAGVALDDGCLFTITGGDTTEPNDGFAVTNADGVPLWDFVRARDLQAIGYPISQRWVDGPFTLQAFQKVILQWDPGKSRMNYYNTLDVLANRYPEVALPNVPPHQVLEADRGADFATITRNHLALLEQNAAIQERFLSEPDWLNPLRPADPLRRAGGQRPPTGTADAAGTADGVRDLERAGAGSHGGPGEPAERPRQGQEAEQRDHSRRSQGTGIGTSGGGIADVLTRDTPSTTRADDVRQLDRGRRRTPPHLRHPHRWHRGLLGQQLHQWDLHRPG